MRHLRPYVTRTQSRAPWRRIAVGGMGSAVAIAVLGLLGQSTGYTLLAATLGASCVLVFMLPEAPVSQPLTLVAGHVVSATVGWLVSLVLPMAWWSAAVAVGLAISTMAVLRVVHPPAGANPIVLLTSTVDPVHLLAPVLVGSVLVVLIGVVAHRLNGTLYPAHVPHPASGATSGRTQATERPEPRRSSGRPRHEPQPTR